MKGKKPGEKVDPEILAKAAAKIGKPQRFNCGFCHFAGGKMELLSLVF